MFLLSFVSVSSHCSQQKTPQYKQYKLESSSAGSLPKGPLVISCRAFGGPFHDPIQVAAKQPDLIGYRLGNGQYMFKVSGSYFGDYFGNALWKVFAGIDLDPVPPKPLAWDRVPQMGFRLVNRSDIRASLVIDFSVTNPSTYNARLDLLTKSLDPTIQTLTCVKESILDPTLLTLGRLPMVLAEQELSIITRTFERYALTFDSVGFCTADKLTFLSRGTNPCVSQGSRDHFNQAPVLRGPYLVGYVTGMNANGLLKLEVTSIHSPDLAVVLKATIDAGDWKPVPWKGEKTCNAFRDVLINSLD